jgi:hypothetical protein
MVFVSKREEDDDDPAAKGELFDFNDNRRNSSNSGPCFRLAFWLIFVILVVVDGCCSCCSIDFAYDMVASSMQLMHANVSHWTNRTMGVVNLDRVENPDISSVRVARKTEDGSLSPRIAPPPMANGCCC